MVDYPSMLVSDMVYPIVVTRCMMVFYPKILMLMRCLMVVYPSMLVLTRCLMVVYPSMLVLTRCLMVGLPWGQFQGCSISPM